MKRFMDKLPPIEALEARCLDLGLCSRRPSTNEMSHVSVTLQPLVLPRAALHELYALQSLWNEAVDRTARNFSLLARVLRETAMSDAHFTGRLLRILEEVYMQQTATSAVPVYQPFMLGIFRTDYMPSVGECAYDEHDYKKDVQAQLAVPDMCGVGGGRCAVRAVFKNVEINTISVSFAYLSPLMSKFHRYLQQYQTVLDTNTTPTDAATAPAGAAVSTRENTCPDDNLHGMQKKLQRQSVQNVSCSANGNTRNEDNNDGSEDSQNMYGEFAWSDSAEKIPAALAAAMRAWLDYMRPAYAYQSTMSTSAECHAISKEQQQEKQRQQQKPVAAALCTNANKYSPACHSSNGDTLNESNYTASEPAVAADAAAALSRWKPVVLVVTQEGECNTADQYGLLFRLLEVHGIMSIRRTLSELSGTLSLLPMPPSAPFALSGSNQMPPCAVIDDTFVAAVVYFRSTYVPADFLSESCWVVRTALERSSAIKCPSVPYHLMTFKKMQQVMTSVQDVLTPICFAGDEAKAKRLAEHFVPQYSLNAAEYGTQSSSLPCNNMGDAASLPIATNTHVAVDAVNKRRDSSDSDDTDTAKQDAVHDPEVYIREAIQHPDRYVLKPQLEGGGNLISGAEMRRVLVESKPGEALYDKIRKEYILMRKIISPKCSSAFFRDNQVQIMPNSVCFELGIYGTILSSGRHTRSGTQEERDSSLVEPHTSSAMAAPSTLFSHDFSCHAGYLVRTKPHGVEEGGVIVGASCLDSLLLV